MGNNMNKIIAINKNHLKHLIIKEIVKNGYDCSLNHIDVSEIIDMSWLFDSSDFNGDISNWDTSSVENMAFLFNQSPFNKDISKWNTSNVKWMTQMFAQSDFNGDISNWDVSKVEKMVFIFTNSQFKGNINEWKPYSLDSNSVSSMFYVSDTLKPYWAKYEHQLERNNAIASYHLEKDLNKELSTKKDFYEKIVKV
jgi:surface protein